MESNRPTTSRNKRHEASVDNQLRLLAPGPWRLSESTRALGREGIANARAALEVARRHVLETGTGEPQQTSAAA
jgi:hypothetical protein